MVASIAPSYPTTLCRRSAGSASWACPLACWNASTPARAHESTEERSLIDPRYRGSAASVWQVGRSSTTTVTPNLAPTTVIVTSWPAYNRWDRSVCRALCPAATRSRRTARGDGESHPRECRMVTQGPLDLERVLKLRVAVALICSHFERKHGKNAYHGQK
jgi:hypothetical protein